VVNLAYSDPNTSTFVSITGTGELVRDRTKHQELWTPVLKAWFPEGLQDPQLTLLKVNVLEAEYWDASSSRMVQLFEMAKALVSGQEFKSPEHEKIKINPYDNR
jgi:general stress protein 26